MITRTSRTESVRLKADNTRLEELVDQQRKVLGELAIDLTRLRGLIKEAENSHEDGCPWCRCYSSGDHEGPDFPQVHGRGSGSQPAELGCRAFNPDRTVR